MASFGHIAVGCFAGRAWAPASFSGRQLFATFVGWSAVALLPDLDVVAFALRIPYEARWGHRGAAHSLLFAVALGVIVGVASLLWRSSAKEAIITGALAIATLASHGLLDTMTTGGLGVALFWPFDDTRYFAPWRPIPVAPIGAGMLTRRGLRVVLVEIVLFSPFWVTALLWRRRRALQ